MKTKHVVGGGLSLGSILAVVMSWTVNHSILLCIVHAWMSWAYVIYCAIVHGSQF